MTDKRDVFGAIVLAGGNGERFQGKKQFYIINGKPLWKHVYDKIHNVLEDNNIVVVGVDVPGGNSSLDLTEAVSGVTFNDGQISFKFTFFKEDNKNRMKNDLHGEKLKIILEREPEYCYDGRLFCRDGDYTGNIYELYIDARVAPYKQERQMTVHTEEITSSKEIILINDRMPSMPSITVCGNISITFNNCSFRLTDGTYAIPEITLTGGINRIQAAGKGSLKLQYRKGKIV